MHKVLLVLGSLFLANTLILSWLFILDYLPESSSTTNAGMFLFLSLVASVTLFVLCNDTWPEEVKEKEDKKE